MKTSDGKKISLESGCSVSFCEKEHCVMFWGDQGSHYRANNPDSNCNDDKLLTPFLHTEDDFDHFVLCLAEMLNLQVMKDRRFERPVYRLVKWEV